MVLFVHKVMAFILLYSYSFILIHPLNLLMQFIPYVSVVRKYKGLMLSCSHYRRQYRAIHW